MCGRYTLTDPGRALAEQFGLEPPSELAPRYNIAPTQEVAIVRERGGREGVQGSGLELALVEWGLPSASRGGDQSRLINARSETVADKPAFRSSFRHRRCLIPADGFFEWRRHGRMRQPFYFRLPGAEPFAFAGLWADGDDSPTRPESCTILTTDANPIVAPVHHRMPVILAPRDHALWLDPGVDDEEPLQPLLRPFEGRELESYAVDQVVNRVVNDGPECIRPIPEPPRNLDLFS